MFRLKEKVRNKYIEEPPEISKFKKAILVEKTSNLFIAYIKTVEEKYLVKIRIIFKFNNDWYMGDMDDKTFKAAMIGALEDAGFVVEDKENFDPSIAKVLDTIGNEIGFRETYQILYGFNCIEEDLDYNFLLE